ncbi:hypothetical protein CTA2_8771, partial [Colletotrichum tanaceti]
MSADSSSPEASAKPALTDREFEILKFAWNCMKTAPELDYQKLAAACGMTNPRSASNAWGAIKKKIFTDVPPAVDEDGKPVQTPKRKRATPAKKKAVPAADDGDELANSDGEEKLVVETPKKKRNTPAKKKAAAAAVAAAAAAADGEGADDEETAPETPAKKKRATPAKRKTPAKSKKAAEAAEAATPADEGAEKAEA